LLGELGVEPARPHRLDRERRPAGPTRGLLVPGGGFRLPGAAAGQDGARHAFLPKRSSDLIFSPMTRALSIERARSVRIRRGGPFARSSARRGSTWRDVAALRPARPAEGPPPRRRCGPAPRPPDPARTQAVAGRS